MSHSLLCLRQLLRFSRWGTRYDHGDEGVRQTLLDFAVQKLLCAGLGVKPLRPAQVYAVLSQRLALDINTPQYLFNSANPLDAVRNMHEQIANHMRVCVAVGGGIESLRGIAASEPILSEAASLIMTSNKTNFSLPASLSLVLTGFSTNQEDREELLVAAFFTWARDRVILGKLPRTRERFCHYFSVTDLFSHLFSESVFASMLDDLPSLCHTKWKRSFGDVFGKATMQFNHVIKPQAQKLLARRFLLYFMARGAATLGTNCQPGFDAVYPYLYDSLNLDVKNVGFIMVQVKNDSNASQSDDANIFKKMDPFECGLLNDSDKEDGRFPIPIIRLLFTLSGISKPGLTQVTYKVPSMGAAVLGEDALPLFTSYDYVCSGISPEVLRPVEESPDTWAALANKPDQWSSFYDVPVPNILRSQIPGCGDHEAHFSSWLGETVFP